MKTYTNRRRRALMLVVLLPLLTLATGAKKQASPEDLASARATVETAMQQILAVLGDEALPTEERRARIEAIAYDNFDFETMSKLVLRRDWKKFSKAQRQDFVKEFKLHLSRSYGSRLDRYNQQEIAILGERAETRGDVKVMTAVVGGQFDGAKVDYRLRKKDEGWLAIDVVIEGVSLVSNFHSQFAEVVGRQGPEGLLKQLREKYAGPELAAASE